MQITHGRSTVLHMPDATREPAEVSDELLNEEDELREENDDDRVPEMFKGPLREDPWGRWPAGQEPVREVEIYALRANDGGNPLIRSASVDLEPGVLPLTRFDVENDDVWELRFRGRWNAAWRGSKLAELSLDCFSSEWDEVIRVPFDPTDPVDLLAAYNAAYPGFWGLYINAEDNPTRNARDERMGHSVSARDPRLALRIASRCPGVCLHTMYFEYEFVQPTKATGEQAQETLQSFTRAAESVVGEPSPGLKLAMDQTKPLEGIAAIMGREAEPPPVPFIEPIATTLDAYSAIGTGTYEWVPEATIVRVSSNLVAGLAAHVTFPDAISAIRRIDPDRLPIWLDFTDDDGEPQRRSHPGGLQQPLYGALVQHESDPDQGGPFNAVAPVGRTVGLIEEPMPLCALAIGPNDSWRFPIPEKAISLITAHRGGVAVRHAGSQDTAVGIEPEITTEEVSREVAGYVAHTTEWVLARIGAVLSAVEDGLLVLKRLPEGTRSFELVRAQRNTKNRQTSNLDVRTLVIRMRELGSLRRVAEAENAEIVAVREVLDKAGVDPDQVRRDEVLQRYRRAASIEGGGGGATPVSR